MSTAAPAPTAAFTPAQEYDAIARTIQQYLDGGRAGSSERMKPAFHASATMFGHLGSDTLAVPIQGLYDWVDANPPASDMVARITSVQVAGTIASARLEIDNWGGHQFTDMFTLLKTDGEWRIINKVFHLHG